MTITEQEGCSVTAQVFQTFAVAFVVVRTPEGAARAGTQAANRETSTKAIEVPCKG